MRSCAPNIRSYANSDYFRFLKADKQSEAIRKGYLKF